MKSNTDYQLGIAEGVKRERQRWLANARLCLELSGDAALEPSRFGAPALQALIVAHAAEKETASAQAANPAPDYVQFALDVLKHSREHLGCDIDGGMVQELATKHGLLDTHQPQEPCGDACVCAEYGDFPQDCYRYSPAVAQAMSRLPSPASSASDCSAVPQSNPMRA